MKAEKELVGEEMGADAVGTDMEGFRVEGGVLQERKIQHVCSLSPEDLQFEEYFSD